MAFRLALHLQPDTQQKPDTFCATLHFDEQGERRQLSRSLPIDHVTRSFAQELAKGGRGVPDPGMLRDARRVILRLLGAVGGDDEFAQQLRSFAVAANSRLVVHFDPALPEPTRCLIESLPWSALANPIAGSAVLLSPKAPGEWASASANVVDPRDPEPLRVLVVLACIEQGTGQTSLQDVATLARRLRTVEGDLGKQQCQFEILASQHTIGLLVKLRDEHRDLILTDVDDRADLLRRLKAGQHHVWHFVGHSNAFSELGPRGVVAPRGAAALLLGFRPFQGNAYTHAKAHSEDVLKADDLGKLLQEMPRLQRPVVTVFDNCAIGCEFLSPVLEHVDHAIGTIGSIASSLGAGWAPTFYSELSRYEPIGVALMRARLLLPGVPGGKPQASRTPTKSSKAAKASRGKKAIPVAADAGVACDWQLAHWAAGDRDRPFGTPAGAALRAYRDHAKWRLEELEGSFRHHSDSPSTVKMESIAIPLAVVYQQRDSDRGRNDGGALLQRQLERRATTELTLLDLLRQRVRLLLLGEAGSGKTTCVRHAADVLLGEIQNGENPSALVPVYLRLPGSKTLQQEHPLLTTVLAEAVEHLPRPDVVREQLAKRASRLVLLLDGYEELQDQELKAAESLMARLVDARQPQVHAFVIACRSRARPVLEGVDEYRIEPLGEDRQRQLLERWFRWAGATQIAAEQRALRVVQQIHEQPGSLRDLMRLPLYLGLLGRIVARQQDEHGLAVLLQRVHRRHAFFEQAICALLTEEHKPADASRQAKRGESRVRRQLWMLGRLAFDRMCRNELRWSYAELEQRIIELARELGNEEWEQWRDWFRGAEVLRPVRLSEPRGEWEFAHRSLLEAMAARYLAAADVDVLRERPEAHAERKRMAFERVAEQLRSGTKAAEDPARFWRETFAMTAGFLGAASAQWINSLLSEPSLKKVALDAVALVAGEPHLDPKEICGALTSNADADWCERRVVYESLLRLGATSGGPLLRSAFIQYALQERVSRGGWRLDRRELWFIDQVFAATAHIEEGVLADRDRDELMRSVGAEVLPSSVACSIAKVPSDRSTDLDPDDYWVPIHHHASSALGGRAFYLARDHVQSSLYNLFDPYGADVSDCGEAPDGVPSLSGVAADGRLKSGDHPHVCADYYVAECIGRWLTARLPHLAEMRLRVRLPRLKEWEAAADYPGAFLPVPGRASPIKPAHGFVRVGEAIQPVWPRHVDRMLGERRGFPGSLVEYRNGAGLRRMLRFLWTWCGLESGAREDVQCHPFGGAFTRPLRGGCYRSLAEMCQIRIVRWESAEFRSPLVGVRLGLFPLDR